MKIILITIISGMTLFQLMICLEWLRREIRASQREITDLLQSLGRSYPRKRQKFMLRPDYRRPHNPNPIIH